MEDTKQLTLDEMLELASRVDYWENSLDDGWQAQEYVGYYDKQIFVIIYYHYTHRDRNLHEVRYYKLAVCHRDKNLSSEEFTHKLGENFEQKQGSERIKDVYIKTESRKQKEISVEEALKEVRSLLKKV